MKLKQDKEKLTGTMTGRAGTETEIEDGKVANDTVTFKVTREFNGNKFVIKYEGKLDSDMIKGEAKFERDGQTQSRPWEAKRANNRMPLVTDARRTPGSTPCDPGVGNKRGEGL